MTKREAVAPATASRDVGSADSVAAQPRGLADGLGLSAARVLSLQQTAGNAAATRAVAAARSRQIQRHGDTATAPAANRDDEQLLQFIQGQAPTFTGIGLFAGHGGMQGFEKTFPKTYAAIWPRAVSAYGRQTVDWLYRNDARVLKLTQASSDLQAKAAALSDTYFDAHKHAAFKTVWEMAKSYEFDYFKAMEGYKTAGDFALTLWEAMLGGSVDEVAALIRSAADKAQSEDDERARLAAERAKVGSGAVGEKVAVREALIFNDNITLTHLLEPTDGEDTEAKAVAAARLTGSACAVLKRGDRWYALALSIQLAFADLWEIKTFQEHRTKLIPKGTPVAALVTTDGYVLRPEGTRFFGGDLSKQSASHLTADEDLLAERGKDMTGDELFVMFKRMTLDVVLANLAAAEIRLTEAQRRLAPDFRLDPAAGAKLQQNAAALRRHMLAASRVAATIDGKDPTPAEIAEAESVLAAIGRIVSEDPAAAMMVKSNRPADAKGPADEGDVTDRVEGIKPGDAAHEALGEIATRLKNVETIRLHLLAHPDDVLALKPVHPEVLLRFSPGQAAELNSKLLVHDLGQLAASLGLLVADLTLLIVGIAAGGPVGLIAWGISAGVGAAQTGSALDEARRLKAMSALDVEGGFQLATPEEAASAQRWAFIALALTVLDLGLFSRSISKMARLRSVISSPDLALILVDGERSIGPIAEKLGMSERALLRELEVASGPARTKLLERMREAAGLIQGGGRVGAKASTWIGKSVEEVEKLRVELLAREDVGRVAASLEKLGVDAERETLNIVKNHLFNSPGIDFLEENYKVWNRLAAGKGSVADAQILAHELAEVRELRLLQAQRPGFDFLGKNYQALTTAQKQRWQADFRRLYGEAHAKALEAEFDYLADQVRKATNGRYPATRSKMAAVDPTPFNSPRSREAAEYMLVDGVPLRDHPQFYKWQAMASDIVEVPTATRTRLGLSATGDIRLDDLVAAVKRARPQ